MTNKTACLCQRAVFYICSFFQQRGSEYISNGDPPSHKKIPPINSIQLRQDSRFISNFNPPSHKKIHLYKLCKGGFACFTL